jgi:hypothetical protein
MPNEVFVRFAYMLMFVISLTLIGQAAVHLARA